MSLLLQSGRRAVSLRRLEGDKHAAKNQVSSSERATAPAAVGSSLPLFLFALSSPCSLFFSLFLPFQLDALSASTVVSTTSWKREKGGRRASGAQQETDDAKSWRKEKKPSRRRNLSRRPSSFHLTSFLFSLLQIHTHNSLTQAPQLLQRVSRAFSAQAAPAGKGEQKEKTPLPTFLLLLLALAQFPIFILNLNQNKNHAGGSSAPAGSSDIVLDSFREQQKQIRELMEGMKVRSSPRGASWREREKRTKRRESDR